MADTVDRRTVELTILAKGLDDVQQQLKRLEQSGKDTADSLANIQGAIDKTADVAKSLIGAFAGFEGIKLFAENINNAIELQAELHKLSEQAGVSVEALSGLQAVAKETGVSFDSVTGGVEKLSKNLVAAAQGTGSAVNAFAALHINARQLVSSGAAASDVFVQVAQKLASMGNEVQRTAYAQQLFGRSGAQLIPVLLQIAEAGGIEAQVTGEQAARAEEYERTLRQLSIAKQQMYNVVAQQVLPVMQALANMWLENVKGAAGLNAKVKELAAQNAIRNWATEAVLAVLSFVERLMDVPKALQVVFEALRAFVGTVVDVFQIAARALMVFNEQLDNAGAVLQGIGLIMAGAIPQGVAVISTALGKAKSDWKTAFADMGQSVDMIAGRWADVTKLIDNFSSNFVNETLRKKFMSALQAVLDKHVELGKKGSQAYGELAVAANDALSKMIQKWNEELAANNLNIQALLATGRETKATNAAKLQALLTDQNFIAVLQKQAAQRGLNVGAIIAEAQAIAHKVDASAEELQATKDLIEVQKQQHDAVWANVDAAVKEEAALTEQIATFGATAQGITAYKRALLEAQAALLETAVAQKQLQLAMTDTETVDPTLIRDLEQLQGLLSGYKVAIDKLGDVSALQGQIRQLQSFRGGLEQAASAVGDIAKAFAQGVSQGIAAAKAKLKEFLLELLAITAQKWFLNLVVSAAGAGSPLASVAGNLAGTVGQNTLAGAASSSLFGTAGTGTGVGALTGPVLPGDTLATPGIFGSGGFAATIGDAAGSVATAFGATAESAALLSETIAAAVPVIGWVVAIGAVLYSLFGHKGGAPKTEGSFSGSFDAGGSLVSSGTAGSQFSNLNIAGSDQGNAAASQIGNTIATSFFSTVKALGGTAPSSVGFGVEFSQDTQGTAPSFVHGGASVGGQQIFSQNLDNVPRGDAELQAAIQQEAGREELAALQHIDFAAPVNAILRSINVESASLADIQKVLTQAQDVATALKGIEALSSYGLTGINLDSLKALQHDGETLTQTMQRLATETQQMDTAFASGATKVGRETAALSTFYQALGSAGFATPTNRQQWLDTFKALDLSTESGRKLHDQMVALAPAFLDVAAAAEKNATAYESIQQSIDKILGRTNGTDRQLNSAVSSFEANNAWAKGKTPDQLVQDLTTISATDFANYSEENQKLITAILSLAATTTTASNTISNAVQQIVFPETGAAQLEGGFQASVGGLVSAQPDMSSKLSLGMTLMQNQVDQWQAAMKGLSPYSTEFQTLATAVADFKAKIELSRGDLAQLTIWTAQYDKAKAEQLLSLKQWYDQQKALLGDNGPALAALQTTFDQKWKDIINGTSSALGTVGNTVRQSILQWHDSLLTSNLSPLTGAGKFQAALFDYQKNTALAYGGDQTALGKYQSQGQTLLQLALQMYGQSSSQYQDLFQTVLKDSLALGTGTDPQVATTNAVTNQTQVLSGDLSDVKELLNTLVAAVNANTTATKRQTVDLTTDNSTSRL